MPSTLCSVSILSLTEQKQEPTLNDFRKLKFATIFSYWRNISSALVGIKDELLNLTQFSYLRWFLNQILYQISNYKCTMKLRINFRQIATPSSFDELFELCSFLLIAASEFTCTNLNYEFGWYWCHIRIYLDYLDSTHY